MKKKTSILIAILLIAVIAVVAFIVIRNNKQPVQVQNDFAIILNQNYPTDILIVGEEITLYEGVTTRHVEHVTEENIKTAEGCIRQVIILSNWNGAYKPEEGELKLISEKLHKLECDFYCLGDSLDNELVAADILSAPHKEGAYAPSVVLRDGELSYSNGITTNINTLDHILTYVIYRMVSDLKNQVG